MSLWTRVTNIVRGDRLTREIDEELQAHLDEAVELGRDPAEARRSFGSPLRYREASRDVRLVVWLDGLRADAVFGWRQLRKNKAASLAAVLSLGLAIGACTAAFRLIDALLLRPLPVAHPDRLYSVYREGIGPDGKLVTGDEWAYPAFRQMRTVVKGRADLIAISYAQRNDLTYQSDQEMEKAFIQYVSGWMFDDFGLRPAAGRLLTAADDQKPGAHPYAVLSYDYWTRRFGRDRNVVGRSFRFAGRVYTIVGVGPDGFTGTEPGTVTDIYVPTMMHPGAVRDDWTWHRTLAMVQPGTALEPLRQQFHATARAFEEERAKGFKGMTRESIDRALDFTVKIQPAAAGTSTLQQDFSRPLIALGSLVALVLLIACANVANLMTAQAAVRAREMALRVSIGAGRARLVQMVLVESATLSFLAAGIGGLFAWWSAPFVVGRINPPDNPARLFLSVNASVLGFAMLLTLVVTFLCGLAPALRASAVRPAATLRGGADPHSRRRLMHALIAMQVAFCFVVLFVAGLFTTSSQRLAQRPTGFNPDRLLTLSTVAQRGLPLSSWEQLLDHLRTVPGVQKVAMSGWPLLEGNAWNGFISVNGAPPGPELAYFLTVSPGWLDAMQLPLLEGRDFRPSESTPGAALVNQAFVKHFLNGQNPLGQRFAKGDAPYSVIGVVHDAPYRNVHEPDPPVVYVPYQASEGGKPRAVQSATLLVRTTNPAALASILRREIPRARSEFRVSNSRTQLELVMAQTVRERLLAMLSLFFAAVALLLAALGLYGVLDYSVLQRRREIGIRVAIGAPATDIARRVIAPGFAMVIAGAAAGVTLGQLSVRYIETVLYDAKPAELQILALPVLALLAAALLAAIPAVIRALRIDPVTMLRAD